MMMNTGIWARRGRQDARGLIFVLLVELHHLFVQALAVTLVQVLQLAHLRLQLLHLEHSLGALQGQGRDEEHHCHGDQAEGDRVVVGPAVEGVDEPGKGV